MTGCALTESRRRFIWNIFWRLCVSLAAIYIGLCLTYVWHQDRNLFPGMGTQGKRYAIVQPSPDYDLVHFTIANRYDITAIFGPALDAGDRTRPDAASRPTIIYFNGNGSTISDDMEEFRAFRRSGCNVLIPDYPGYGMRRLCR